MSTARARPDTAAGWLAQHTPGWLTKVRAWMLAVAGVSLLGIATYSNMVGALGVPTLPDALRLIGKWLGEHLLVIAMALAWMAVAWLALERRFMLGKLRELESRAGRPNSAEPTEGGLAELDREVQRIAHVVEGSPEDDPDVKSLSEQVRRGSMAFEALAAPKRIARLNTQIEPLEALLKHSEENPDLFIDRKNNAQRLPDALLSDLLYEIRAEAGIDPEFEELASRAGQSPELSWREAIRRDSDRLEWSSDESKEAWHRAVWQIQGWLALLRAVRRSEERARDAVR